MKFKSLSVVFTICLVVCVAMAIGLAISRSWEAGIPMTLPLEFIKTEFSSDGGETWKPVGDGRELRRQRDDVIIRGHFNYDVQDDWVVHFRFQHMQMELVVNGEIVATHAREFTKIRPEWCTDIWACFNLPSISKDELVEFRLYSLHPDGAKKGAYEKVLSSLKLGDPFFIYQAITTQNTPGQYAGLTLMIVGSLLFGIAFVALWMKSPLQKIMMYTALFTVGEGLFWLADASEIGHYVYGSIAFFSTGRYVSRLLCFYALLAIAADLSEGKVKLTARITAHMSGIMCIGYLLLNMLGVVSFCESEHIWVYIQLVFLVIGFACCVCELAHRRKTFWQFLRLFTLGMVYASFVFEHILQVMGWNTENELSKLMCGAVAFAHAAALLVQLPASYAAIRRAEKLSEELHNSRIVLAMSQIRTHFIFNVLNAISSLCKSDPELADVELVRFSRYLRNNIDIMQEDKPIPFEQALEHMHNYVDLEQLRFGDKIILDENYEYINFVIPSLVIQPLVENAIKHGLLPKAESGIIRISTSRHANEVMIEIVDNGVGFETSKKIEKTSVGLSNVRFRVEQMMKGRMQLESKPGVGTRVRLWLPIGKEESSFTLSV